MPEENQEWTMPAWIEPYRDLIGSTGGHDIEWLMNQEPDSCSNTTLYALIISVQSQIALLRVLRKEGMLRRDTYLETEEDAS